MNDVTRVIVWMKDMEKNKADFENAYKQFFSHPLPVRALTECSEIPLPNEPTEVEIMAEAVIKLPIFKHWKRRYKHAKDHIQRSFGLY